MRIVVKDCSNFRIIYSMLGDIGYNAPMVWLRAGFRGDFLSVYTELFYEPLALENR
ncbi:MAG: hypothetical protein IPM71_08080 [Bacteroidota bacterium]|nr:MAG: hypothetical protein IPM71_08080 [Bacteroidota bacterium]